MDDDDFIPRLNPVAMGLICAALVAALTVVLGAACVLIVAALT